MCECDEAGAEEQTRTEREIERERDRERERLARTGSEDLIRWKKIQEKSSGCSSALLYQCQDMLIAMFAFIVVLNWF